MPLGCDGAMCAFGRAMFCLSVRRGRGGGARVACVVALVALGGCQSNVLTNDESAEGVAACEGAIHGSATVVADDLPEDWLDSNRGLVAAGDALLLTTKTTVELVDPCSGERTELATDDRIVDSAIYAGQVYFIAQDIMGVVNELRRVPLAGGSIESLGDIGTGRVVASPEGVFALRFRELGAYELLDVTEGATETVVLTLNDAGITGYSARPIGASAAGIYLRESWDSGSPLRLRRWPYGGDALGVEGTAGANAIAVDGDDLVALLGFADVPSIVRLPAEGGEATEVVSSERLMGTATRLEAASGTTCWLTAEEATPLCLRDGETTPRALGPPGGHVGALVLRDALYWLREGENGSELVAAVP